MGRLHFGTVAEECVIAVIWGSKPQRTLGSDGGSGAGPLLGLGNAGALGDGRDRVDPATPRATVGDRDPGLGRSWRDGTETRRDRGRGSARAPHPQAGRPAALCLVMYRGHGAGGGWHRGQRHHVRRGDRYRGRGPPAAACACRRGQSVLLFALLILPVAMAVQLLVRRQFRRLGEAVATGVLAAALTAVINDLLTRPAASRLYYAIIMVHPGTSHAAALDPYLAGLVAYATMVGLVGPYWRNALWAAIAVYAIVHVGALHTSVLTLLITVLGGRAIGLAVRYVAGSASQRPSALDIAGALAATGLPVTSIRRDHRQEPRQGNPSRHYRSRPRETARAGRRRVRPGPADGRRRTGCTGACGYSGRCHATPRCRWSTRSSAGPCCATRPRTRTPPGRGCAPWSGPVLKLPCWLTSTRRGRRWPSGIPAAATLSSARYGTRPAGCTPTGSRTGA